MTPSHRPPTRALAVIADANPGAADELATLAAAFAEEAEEVASIADVSAATLAAYASDWRAFEAYCASKGVDDSGSPRVRPLPAHPATIAGYMAHMAMAGKARATRDRAFAAISVRHRHEFPKMDNPCKAEEVRRTRDRLARKYTKAQRRAEVLLGADLSRVVRAMPADIEGLRDRALILLGWSGALRESEIVGLDVGDLRFTSANLVITLRVSKTNQEGRLETVVVPRDKDRDCCPVATLRRWMDAAKIEAGAVFRTVMHGGKVREKRLPARYVDDIVREAVRGAGIDPTGYSGHSLRRGFVTTARRAGVSQEKLMAHTRHKSVTSFAKYVQEEDKAINNPAAGLRRGDEAKAKAVELLK